MKSTQYTIYTNTERSSEDVIFLLIFAFEITQTHYTRWLCFTVVNLAKQFLSKTLLFIFYSFSTFAIISKRVN